MIIPHFLVILPSAILHIAIRRLLIKVLVSARAVLARIRVLVVEKLQEIDVSAMRLRRFENTTLLVNYLDKVVETTGNNGAQCGTKPVDPVISCERRSCHTRAEATRGVHRCASVVDAGEFDDEERKANSDGCDERVFGLLGREHEDCEDEVSGQELVQGKSASQQQRRAVSSRVGSLVPSLGIVLGQCSCSALMLSALSRCRPG